MVGIGNADIGGGVRSDVGDHIVVNFPVIGVQPQVHGDIGVQRFKIGDGLLVDGHLGQVGVVLCPEGDLKIPPCVEGVRDHKCSGALRRGRFLRQLRSAAVAARERADKRQSQRQSKDPFHPFVPPRATPAMIFFRNTRNSTISGAEITTTAAIMAGMFSRPKPFSRIS